ncbi:hypothetical protein [Streptomyces sp. NPDC127072]|uniref:hypothetical protein n=1 Tax=Streptomyces sp. NPDC127072 TaxID=3347129 RepID=UPI0036613184
MRQEPFERRQFGRVGEALRPAVHPARGDPAQTVTTVVAGDDSDQPSASKRTRMSAAPSTT